MRLSNKKNLPNVILRALENDSYDAGDSDYTASQIVKPPQIIALEHKHQDDIEEDASDRIWSLFGQLGHTLLERAGDHNEITEKRYFATFCDKWKLSAQVDSLCMVSGTLTDWKMTSAWGFCKDKEPKQEWVIQMNVQAEILRRNDIYPEKLQIGGLLRDWTFKNVQKYMKYGYPTCQIAVLDIPMWSEDDARKYISAKCEELDRAKEGNYRSCTSDERWKDKVRCSTYCGVSKWCSQWAKEVNF